MSDAPRGSPHDRGEGATGALEDGRRPNPSPPDNSERSALDRAAEELDAAADADAAGDRLAFRMCLRDAARALREAALDGRHEGRGHACACREPDAQGTWRPAICLRCRGWVFA